MASTVANIHRALCRSALDRCQQALEDKGFAVYRCADAGRARRVVREQILPRLKPRSASWADSMTLRQTGILEDLRAMEQVQWIETFDPACGWEETIRRRRRALLVDLFFTGTNAVTAAGQLVNLDMIGNRVAALAFGPRHVVLAVGRNKVVADLAAAMDRIRRLAAPANAIRHATFRTPCRRTGRCMDCAGPDRICNTWSIVEACHPPGRIHVLLIDQDLGL